MLQNEFLWSVGLLAQRAAHQGFKPLQMAGGDGIVIIHDSQNEYDVYFDADKWEYVHPEIWASQTRLGVGVLPGTGNIPPVRSFEEGIRFAAYHLKSKDPAWQLYPQPQLIDS